MDQPVDREAIRREFLRAYPCIGIAIFISAIDQTITATALPAMAAHFGVVERISWVVVAYLVAATIAAPVFGKLGDAFGRRPMLFVAYALQAVGALCAGLAPNFEALLAARILHGFGGGALLTLAMALIGESLPPRERGRYQAYFVACFMSASAAGPLAGGWLTQHWGWQWVFLGGLPLVGFGVFATWKLPRRPRLGAGFYFDAAGTVLFTIFVGALLLVMDQAQRLSWDALWICVPLALVSAAAFLLLLRIERRVNDPLLHIPMLTDPVIWRTNALATCVAGVMVAMISFLPLYLTVVRGVPIATVGAMLLPMSLGGGLGALCSGQFLARTGRNMLLPSIALAVSTLALCYLSAFMDRVPLEVLPWLLALVTFGSGCSFPAVQTTVQVAAGVGRVGVATASVQFMRNLGSAAGTALLGAVLFGAFAAADSELAARFAAAMRAGREALAALPGEERALMAAGLAGGFHAMLAGAAVLMGAATVLAWRVPLRRV
ncbi:MFS transporter [Roseococcus sp. YIM B11640]|uniref:MFS transporter n=1 Tax=Roseococcus sp. YIM B11640 TaxID=3133973 RepID=UPI003C7E405B